MQVQNVTGAISNFCGAVGQAAVDSASWVGRTVVNWSSAGYDLLVRIASATKEYLTMGWNAAGQGLSMARDFVVAHQTEAAIVGVTAGAVLGMVALYNYFSRPATAVPPAATTA